MDVSACAVPGRLAAPARASGVRCASWPEAGSDRPAAPQPEPARGTGDRGGSACAAESTPSPPTTGYSALMVGLAVANVARCPTRRWRHVGVYATTHHGSGVKGGPSSKEVAASTSWTRAFPDAATWRRGARCIQPRPADRWSGGYFDLGHRDTERRAAALHGRCETRGRRTGVPDLAYGAKVGVCAERVHQA